MKITHNHTACTIHTHAYEMHIQLYIPISRHIFIYTHTHTPCSLNYNLAAITVEKKLNSQIETDNSFKTQTHETCYYTEV